MLETEKKQFTLYRIDRDTRLASAVTVIRLALYQTSDRRDEDKDALGVFLKKTYRGICDSADVREGDVIRLSGQGLRVISVIEADGELLLHLESTQILDTGAFDFQEVGNV